MSILVRYLVNTDGPVWVYLRNRSRQRCEFKVLVIIFSTFNFPPSQFKMHYPRNYYYVSVFCGIFLVFSIFVLFYFLYLIGLGGFLSYLLPASIAVIVFGFYFVAGVSILKNPGRKGNITLVQIALLAQTFQLDLLGLKFKNYYGPYLGVGFTDTPEFTWIFRLRPIDYLLGNGFGKSDEISVIVNVFALILFAIFTKLSENVKPENTDAFTEVYQEK